MITLHTATPAMPATLASPTTPITPTTPSPTSPATTLRGPRLIPVNDGLWRVTGSSGTVLGHIERREDAQGARFAARRIVAAARTVPLGEFWRIDDATDCFR